MTIVEKIKKHPKLKALIYWMIVPRNQARPRWWIKVMVNPFKHHFGKRSLICRSVRRDLFPFGKFSIGDNSTVEDFSTLNNGVGEIEIGSNTRIGMGCVLIGPVKIGNDVRLAQNVVCSGLNHGYQDVHLPIWKQPVTTSAIIIEDESWIGANVVVTLGVTIGKHCVIAAGSVVTKNIPAYSVAAGVPARVIKAYNRDTKTWEKVSP